MDSTQNRISEEDIEYTFALLELAIKDRPMYRFFGGRASEEFHNVLLKTMKQIGYQSEIISLAEAGRYSDAKRKIEELTVS